MFVLVLRKCTAAALPTALTVSALLAVTAPARADDANSKYDCAASKVSIGLSADRADPTLISQQFGQPAGSALDQPDTTTPPAGQPQSFGQPAGSALDQPLPANMVPPPGQPQAQINTDRIPQGMAPGVQFSPGPMAPQNAPGQIPQQPCPIDLNTATFGRLDLELDNAQFLESAVDKLHLIVNDLDMKNGTLSGLDIAVKGGMFRDMAFDQLSIVTQQGQMSFNRSELLNNRILQFAAPVEAQVTAIVSQDSLNRFLNAPETLQRLSVVGAQKMKFLASMLGSNANIGLTLSQATVQLEKGSRVNVAVQAKVGMGGMGVPLPLAVDTKLALNDDGWIALADTHLISNGQEISPLLSQMLVKKFNEMTMWQKSDDIHFRFRELKVVANKQFIVKGTAVVNRLRFGRQ
jgi:hypothetical protein